MAMDFRKTVSVRLIYAIVVFLTFGKRTAAFSSDRNIIAGKFLPTFISYEVECTDLKKMYYVIYSYKDQI